MNQGMRRGRARMAERSDAGALKALASKGHAGSIPALGMEQVMISDLKEVFEKNDDEYGKFERIGDPPSRRPDLCAFLLLDRLVPKADDVIGGADHDIIFLDVEAEELAKVATEEDIVYLTRCGVFLSSEFDCLCMFV